MPIGALSVILEVTRHTFWTRIESHILHNRVTHFGRAHARTRAHTRIHAHRCAQGYPRGQSQVWWNLRAKAGDEWRVISKWMDLYDSLYWECTHTHTHTHGYTLTLDRERGTCRKFGIERETLFFLSFFGFYYIIVLTDDVWLHCRRYPWIRKMHQYQVHNLFIQNMKESKGIV